MNSSMIRKIMPVIVGFLLIFTSQLLFAACDSLATFADGLTPQRELHVATTGNDETGDGTQAAPYATIQVAARAATPGTALIVHTGVYSGGIYLYNLSGTQQAPIWIGGAAGESLPVIDGGTEGIHASYANFIILHDLEVRNSSANGINFDDGGDYANENATRYVVFDNLNIHDIGGSGNQDGLKLSGVNDYYVLNCVFARCGGGTSGSGIDQVGCHRGVIAGCFFDEMAGNAIQCKGGSEDIEIRWCRFKNAGERSVNLGGSTGPEYFRPPLSTAIPNAEARRLQVVANIFEGSTAPVAFVGCVDTVVANNTIIDPDNWILRILQETVSSGSFEFLPCSNNRFENNLIYFNRSTLSTSLINIGSNTVPDTFVFAHNLWFAHDNPADSTPVLPTTETGGIYAQDPQLFDAAGGDFRIDQHSPAAGSGLAPALIAGDYNGSCYRLPPSIGAFAFVGGCPGDLNPDGDVDGRDLAILADNPSMMDLEEFTVDFGKTTCGEILVRELAALEP
jgi:Right handed beta helix region